MKNRDLIKKQNAERKKASKLSEEEIAEIEMGVKLLTEAIFVGLAAFIRAFENGMSRRIYSDNLAIEREYSDNLQDWQIIRVEIDHRDTMIFYPKGGQYLNRIYRHSTWRNAPLYVKAFETSDWKFFDDEYDTALTFEWC